VLLSPVDLALSFLKAGKAYRESRPDAWPPNYNEAYDEDDFSVEEAEHRRLNPPPMPEPEPEPEPEQEEELFGGYHDEHEFWGGHALVRMAGDRTEDDENQQIRDRINAALSTHLDKHGMFKMTGPKSFGIRTHILDNHRSADESNGDSIWGMIYPKTKRHGWPGAEKRNEPFLKTVMLRNSELSANPQSKKGGDFNPPVEKVIQAHGIPKRKLKEMQRDADKVHGRRRHKRKAEPMEIAFQLLKERKSPAALAHKLEYDKQYQKNPKRVKYREQLNAERRKRGIYGKGGKDISHTQGGKLTLESPHANRARHFKNRGTLRRVKVR
tara:strand:- start:940 stop:1917 length:978 start_codon:yes stop_codon:yes gene_type:complete